MNREDEKKKAWREWHSGYAPEGIPQGNPAFDRGFNAAWDAMSRELRNILSQIEFAQFEPESFDQTLELAL